MPFPYRIVWLEEARADVRRLDRGVAMQLFEGILRFSRTGVGHVAPLHGEFAGVFRLRSGDYRVLFRVHDDVMRIYGVRHRSEAYRSTAHAVRERLSHAIRSRTSPTPDSSTAQTD